MTLYVHILRAGALRLDIRCDPYLILNARQSATWPLCVVYAFTVQAKKLFVPQRIRDLLKVEGVLFANLRCVYVPSLS